MNYRRLQYFLAVVDAGTVTAAAEHLHIAQPALSRQVKTLEREVKIGLFEAHGNRLVLTPAGRAFVPLARRLLVETRSTEEAIDHLRTGRVNTLVVAATVASIRGFLAPFLATTTPEDPIVLTRIASHFQIEDSLLHGADFIVSPTAPVPGLDWISLGSIPLSAYVSPRHEWAEQGRRQITLEELCSNHLLLPSHESVSRHILDDALNQSSLRAEQISECDDGQTIIALSAAGHGVGITTDQPRYGAHSLRIVKAASDGAGRPILKLPLHLAWMPGHFAAATIRDLGARIADFLLVQGAIVPPSRSPAVRRGKSSPADAERV